MGQANKRGNFQQRLHEAYDRKEAQEANIAALTGIENVSTEQRDQVVAMVVKRQLESYAKSSNPLIRIDFSLLAKYLPSLHSNID